MNKIEGAPGEADVDLLRVSGSATHDKPQESMGSEPPRQSEGAELPIGPVRQRSSISIGELESDMKANGMYTAQDREVISLMLKADSNGNGRIDAHEAVTLVHGAAQVRQSREPVPVSAPPPASHDPVSASAPRQPSDAVRSCTRTRSRVSTSSGCASG